MANNNGTSTAPIRQYVDIRTVTQNPATGLWALAVSAYVNIWSKYKPIYWYNCRFVRDEHPTDWWMGNDSTNGLPSGLIGGLRIGYNKYRALWTPSKTPALVTLGTNARTLDFSQCTGFLPDLAKGTTGQWEYVLPNYARQLDFDGYCHKAINPLPVVTNQTKTLRSNESVDIYISVPTQVTGGLTLDDLKPKGADGNPVSLADCYIGLFLYTDSLGDCIFVTQTAEQRAAQRNSSSKSVTLKADSESGFGFVVGTKTYKAKAFFSPNPIKINDRRYDDYGAVVTQDLVRCSDVPGTITLTVRAPLTGYVEVSNVSLQYLDTTKAIRVVITFRNGTTQTHSVTGGMIRLTSGTRGSIDYWSAVSSDIQNTGSMASDSSRAIYVDIPYTGGKTGNVDFNIHYEIDATSGFTMDDTSGALWIY